VRGLSKLRVAAAALVVLAALVTAPHARAATANAYIYFDENERELLLSDPGGTPADLVPYYDPNGQMCIFPDGSGRFTPAVRAGPVPGPMGIGRRPRR
jgi:hypothetical protein